MSSKYTYNQGSSKSPALFAPGTEFRHNAYPETSYFSWNLRAQGFRHAAERLIDAWPEFSIFGKNVSIYPILFNFRMYIELILKDIVREDIKAVSGGGVMRGKHDLIPQWNTCCEVIRRRKLPVDHAEISRLDGYIKEFDKIDPKSQTFRYPIRPDGTLWFQQTPGPINLANLQMVMFDITELLEKISNLLYADIDLENEFKCELYPEA